MKVPAAVMSEMEQEIAWLKMSGIHVSPIEFQGCAMRASLIVALGPCYSSAERSLRNVPAKHRAAEEERRRNQSSAKKKVPGELPPGTTMWYEMTPH